MSPRERPADMLRRMVQSQIEPFQFIANETGCGLPGVLTPSILRDVFLFVLDHVLWCQGVERLGAEREDVAAMASLDLLDGTVVFDAEAMIAKLLPAEDVIRALPRRVRLLVDPTPLKGPRLVQEGAPAWPPPGWQVGSRAPCPGGHGADEECDLCAGICDG